MAKSADTTNPIVRKCSVEGCDKKHLANGYCGMHRYRIQRGLALDAPHMRQGGRACSVESCKRPYYAKDYCRLHWGRHRKSGFVGGCALLAASPGGPALWLQAHVNHKGDACLTWPFARNGDGRAAGVVIEGRREEAARAMCRLAHGDPPFANADAAHFCGKGHLGCVHPDHLSWKTRKGNVADTYIHGTIMRGDRHYAARLSEDDVRKIRRDTRSDTELAELYGVSRTNIHAIRTRRSWAHIA